MQEICESRGLYAYILICLWLTRMFRRQEVATRQSIVTLFLDRFTLSQDEVEAIISREVPIGKRFFAAMNKAESIQLDCRVLMSGETGSTKAGYDFISNYSGMVLSNRDLDWTS